jgi:spore coat protein U-like protein
MKTTKLLVSLAALAAGVLAGAPAFAATATASLTISATVPGACAVSTAPVSFGNYTGTAQVTANGSVTVNCTVDQAYSVELNAGLGGGTTRQMNKTTDATKHLPYELYKDAAFANPWGGTAYAVGGASAMGSLAGSGADQIYPVYGRILTGLPVSQGSFQDTVTVTVLY